MCGNFQKPLAGMVISEAGPHLCLDLDCSQLLSGFPDPDRFDLFPMESSASYSSSPCAECVGYVQVVAAPGTGILPSWRFVIMAQMMRAILLIRAIATSMRGFLTSIRSSQ